MPLLWNGMTNEADAPSLIEATIAAFTALIRAAIALNMAGSR